MAGPSRAGSFYDPELDLIFYGTANPGPWNPNQRPGDNLWTHHDLRPRSGHRMAKWAYRTSPHDRWDHDRINELLLLDLEIDGDMREVVVRPRTGPRDRARAVGRALGHDDRPQGRRPRDRPT